MQRKIPLCVNARLLSTDEQALRQVLGLLAELEEKGLIEHGQLVFDSSKDEEVEEIFNRNLGLTLNKVTSK